MQATLYLARTHTFGRSARRWNADKLVTFILALAVSGTVTFAAAAVGRSRRSAYALRRRNAGFARLWDQALAAARTARAAAARGQRKTAPKGNEVDEVEDPPIRHGQGNKCASPRGAMMSKLGRRSATSKMRPPAAPPQPRLGARLARNQRVTANFANLRAGDDAIADIAALEKAGPEKRWARCDYAHRAPLDTRREGTRRQRPAERGKGDNPACGLPYGPSGTNQS